MGLASKLAAAQANPGAGVAGVGAGAHAAAGGAVPQSYAPPPQQTGQQQFGQQQQYAPPSGAPPTSASARPGQQQQFSNLPPPPGGHGQYGSQGFPQAQPSQGQQPPAYTQYGASQGQNQYGQQGQQQYGQPQQQQQYGQPQQQQYGQPQQQQQYGQPQQQQYGQPQHQQYGQQQQQFTPSTGAPPAAAAAGSISPQSILQTLNQCVQDQGIQAFYPQGSLDIIATKVATSGVIQKVAQEWRLPMELAVDLAKLSLFDIVILADNSGSMSFEEGGSRIDDLKLILSRVAFATSLFDHDGISVRFLNGKTAGDNLTTEQQALQLVSQVKFSGLTPLGTSLQQKILEPMVLQPARANRLQKPVVVICITDGTPAGDQISLQDAILRADAELRRTRYGPDAVSYQFAQVGLDLKATQFLGALDNDPRIGGLIDSTSAFEIEQEEMMRKSGQDLTPEMWLVKLLMGPIDSSYDTKDE